MLQDMILAAINEANRKVDEANEGQTWRDVASGTGWIVGLKEFRISDAKLKAIRNSNFESEICKMLEYAEPVTKLIDELKRLPGIGHKSASGSLFTSCARQTTNSID